MPSQTQIQSLTPESTGSPGAMVPYMIGFGLLLPCVVFFLIYSFRIRKRSQEWEAKAKDVEKQLEDVKKNAESIVKSSLVQAKEIALKENSEFEIFKKEKTSEIEKLEKRLQKREETLEKKSLQIEQKTKELDQKLVKLSEDEKQLLVMRSTAEKMVTEFQERIEGIAGLSQEEARQLLKQSIESDVKKAVAADVRAIEEEAKKSADDRAKSIVANAIQRVANEFVTDACVSVISLPNDEMKGRIIGREGRNIRAIEQATGVDIIIDDTPEAVIISCFNPIRREVAKIAIERLVADGRIHPARIDEVVGKVTQEMDQIIRETGEKACFDCGIQGLHPELVLALGKLKYRSTGGQSILQHSIETAYIAGVLATELDVNVRLVKRAALLHDIGKSIDEETEGNHARVGAQLAKKCGEHPDVVEAIAKHHNEGVHGCTLPTVLVQASNSLSGFRPGARKSYIDRSIARLRDLETMVSAFDGVAQAYVVRSGREVRAMVTPDVLDDQAVVYLAKSVANKIKNELSTNNGQIKVTMVRETRYTELAN